MIIIIKEETELESNMSFENEKFLRIKIRKTCIRYFFKKQQTR